MFVPIKLDKPRNFKFSMKVISNIEEQFGKQLMEIPGMGNGQLTMKNYATVMCEGLKHEDPDLTPDKVMDLIDEYSDIMTVSEAMWKALNGVLSGDKSSKKENPPERGEQKDLI
jgi:hypothetical protein